MTGRCAAHGAVERGVRGRRARAGSPPPAATGRSGRRGRARRRDQAQRERGADRLGDRRDAEQRVRRASVRSTPRRRSGRPRARAPDRGCATRRRSRGCGRPRPARRAPATPAPPRGDGAVDPRCHAFLLFVLRDGYQYGDHNASVRGPASAPGSRKVTVDYTTGGGTATATTKGYTRRSGNGDHRRESAIGRHPGARRRRRGEGARRDRRGAAQQTRLPRVLHLRQHGDAQRLSRCHRDLHGVDGGLQRDRALHGHDERRHDGRSDLHRPDAGHEVPAGLDRRMGQRHRRQNPPGLQLLLLVGRLRRRLRHRLDGHAHRGPGRGVLRRLRDCSSSTTRAR